MRHSTDPFAVSMVLLRIGSMHHYRGVASGDQISGGGAFVDEHGYGGEMFNFQSYRDQVYGYVRPPSPSDSWHKATIDLSRISPLADGQLLKGVLVIWVATSPSGGGYVVGWYRKATVYRGYQDSPPDPNRTHEDREFGYYVSARRRDVVLLAPDGRLCPVPQSVAGGFGNSNVFYADDHAKHRALRRNLLRFISTRQAPRPPKGTSSVPRQCDPLLRQKVEVAAVSVTTKHFSSMDYSVGSVERDNMGWDLNAVYGSRWLRLEVKGLSGSEAVVDLTPNEFAAMQRHRDSYRLCIVTNALSRPRLEVFAYSPEMAGWTSADGRLLRIEKFIAVRCTAS